MQQPAPAADSGGKHGGQPSDKPWTPDPTPPSPDGSGGKCNGAGV